MRFDAGQFHRQTQQMKLSPRMIQANEILQLSALALEERIEQEIVNNPTLELREPGSDSEAVEADLKQQERDSSEGERELTVQDDTVDASHKDDFERLNNFKEEVGESWSNAYDGESYRPARNTGERDGKMDAMANTAARGTSLTEQLIDQWHLVETTPQLRLAGEYIIGFVDADGYLRVENQTMIEQSPPNIEIELFDEAIEALQQNLEPVGLCARDVRECFLLQIDAKMKQLTSEGGNSADYSLERLLVSEYLKDIENNRLPKIAKATNHEIEEIKDAILHLRRFQPHPGRSLVEDRQRRITPDGIVEYDDEEDRYVAILTRDRFPGLCISSVSQDMAKDRKLDPKTREFVNNNISTGKWLMEAIHRRHSTLLRVINVVIDAQRAFFDDGPLHLKPLPMTLVADQLGLDVSTISRAVSEKYIQTPRGILPLRMFFSGGTETQAGEQVSWTAMQAKLKEVIDNEDKAKPFSDEALVKEVKSQHGVDLARRTIAKYRKQLNIASARQRKEF
jgi:RNA polymerase sigma-54 factor